MALLLLANKFYIGIDEKDCSVKEMEQKKKKKGNYGAIWC